LCRFSILPRLSTPLSPSESEEPAIAAAAQRLWVCTVVQAAAVTVCSASLSAEHSATRGKAGPAPLRSGLQLFAAGGPTCAAVVPERVRRVTSSSAPLRARAPSGTSCRSRSCCLARVAKS
jgi:hypothetical protein